MTIDVGQEIVAAYLQHIKGCEFIQLNLPIADTQGEINVVGIVLKTKTVYACEVAIHLATGLQYTKGSQPNNIEKLTEKLSKDIEYINEFFPDYEKHFMLWSPIVRKSGATAKHSQMIDIEEIQKNIAGKYRVTVEFIINEQFLARLNELRAYAREQTKELKSPVLRLMQIEEHTRKHVMKSVKE